MKKTILFLIIVLLLITIVSSQVNEEPVLTDDLEEKVLEKNESSKVLQYYIGNLPEAKSVKDYVTDGKHVIISFDGTQYRVITTKDNFDKLIK